MCSEIGLVPRLVGHLSPEVLQTSFTYSDVIYVIRRPVRTSDPFLYTIAKWRPFAESGALWGEASQNTAA